MTKVTLEAWIFWKGSNGADVNFVMGKGVEELEIHTGGGSGNYGLRFIPTNSVYLDTPTNIFEANNWYHIAFVYEPSSSFAKGYINGKEVILTNRGNNPLSTAI
nr:hypothetical protein [Melioribacteraceae bacterium]